MTSVHDNVIVIALQPYLQCQHRNNTTCPPQSQHVSHQHPLRPTTLYLLRITSWFEHVIVFCARLTDLFRWVFWWRRLWMFGVGTHGRFGHDVVEVHGQGVGAWGAGAGIGEPDVRGVRFFSCGLPRVLSWRWFLARAVNFVWNNEQNYPLRTI